MSILLSLLALSLPPLAPPVCGPVAEDPAALVAEGRDLLELDLPEDARFLFEHAAELDPSPLGPRTWVLRAWIAEGRINDALDATEALTREGVEGPMIDYLFGVAFATKALGYLRDGTGGGVLTMAFGDAVQFLEAATKVEPERFWDAWPLLAECAWHVQRLELAREAAERALARTPADPDATLRLAKIALAQFVAANGAPETQAEADAAWSRAVEALRAMLAVARPLAPPTRARLATELGHALIWKQDLDAAGQAYAEAIAADPSGFDYLRIAGLLDATRLATSCARAGELRTSAGWSEDATLDWWNGWALISAERWREAEDSFLRAVSLRPDFTSSWYWVVHARERDGREAEALALLRERLAEDGEGTRLVLAEDPAAGLALVDRVVAWAAEHDELEQAAELSLVQAELAGGDPRYWNNAGLFLRDAGERLTQRGADAARAGELFECSYEAYLRGLERSPEDPALLNDTAVILHYYLHRELERADAMYARAVVNAERELARDDLSDELRELYRVALRDARANRAKLTAERGGVPAAPVGSGEQTAGG